MVGLREEGVFEVKVTGETVLDFDPEEQDEVSMSGKK